MTQGREPNHLHLARSNLGSATAFRGRLMTAAEIAQDIFRDHKSAEWVRRNLPNKVVLGHSTVMWYEADVWEFIESRREGGT